MSERIAEALDLVVRAFKLGEYDSNVIGMAAEVIAEVEFGMTKAPRGSRDVDGTWFVDGREHKVQVKAWSEGRVKKYRRGTFLTLKENSLPDVLLCMIVYCSKPGYEIIYNGPPTAVGKVEVNRPVRVIRFDHMKTADEVASILQRLGLEERPRASRAKVTQIESGSAKLCSICGVSFPVEEFEYGGKQLNSYCTSCCRLHGQAYARGGSEATRQFREGMRKNWSK
ncbi:MAG: hypothetical protein PSX80_16505 [bacterium]|nr:hypothetical protein [bacterium]